MSDDILARIDEVMAANARRFDPFGEAWDEGRVEQVDDGMRVRQAVQVPAERPHAASPYLTRQDITGEPDRAAEAFRAEALRQGLTECRVDGVPWEYRGGAWKQVEALRPAAASVHLDGADITHYVARRSWWARWLL